MVVSDSRAISTVTSDRMLRPFRAPQAGPEEMLRVLPGMPTPSIPATGARGLLKAGFKSQDPALW